MGEIGQVAIPEIEKIMVQDTQQEIIQSFNYFSGRVNSLLNQINQFSLTIQSQSNQLEFHDDGTISGSSVMRMLKQTEAISNWNNTIEELLRNGSQLIQEIRTFFTGETIKYNIGIMYYGQIYEFEVPESVLLEHVKISYGTKRTDFSKLFTLKLGASGYGKKSLIELWQNYQIQSTTGRLNTQEVYEGFVNDSNIANKNQGNIYEATKKYQYQKGRRSRSDVFSTITSNIVASTKGGDFDDIQYKFFGKSSPTLADMSVITNTLYACRDLFNLSNSTEIGQKVREIFVKDRSQVDSKIEITSLKEINKHVDKIVAAIGR